jgi:hypothetical protein
VKRLQQQHRSPHRSLARSSPHHAAPLLSSLHVHRHTSPPLNRVSLKEIVM